MDTVTRAKTREIIAYLAGIIDGEGCITLANQPSHYRRRRAKYHENPTAKKDFYMPRLKVGMTDSQPIDLLFVTFGGRRRIQSAKSTRKLVYHWEVTGRPVISKVLLQLYPYLRVKRPQADLMLEFCDGWKHLVNNPERASEAVRRQELYLAMRKLNGYTLRAETKRREIERSSDSPNLAETSGELAEAPTPPKVMH